VSDPAGSGPAARRVTMKVWRGEKEQGSFQDYEVDVQPGVVVLDVLHKIQAEQQPDLAVRWNCKAGKCGSCSAEVNGKPVLTCMCRMDRLPTHVPVTVEPMRTFPHVKDLVTDVSLNYEVNRTIAPFQPRPREADGTHRMSQEEVDRVQEYRKCIECFLCQDVCHVLRNHAKQGQFAGPRYFVRIAGLETHPLDTADRLSGLKNEHGLGYCNITKCCTEVCPEHIKITDNAIIPLKERVVTRFYDPVARVFRSLFGKRS
jgi:succinate dehydrogenase / fumarate reductase iron-sulfur subunit